MPSLRFLSFKLTTAAAAGKVLTSDVDGVGTWQAPSGSDGTALAFLLA